jgi:hypothetical protein
MRRSHLLPPAVAIAVGSSLVPARAATPARLVALAYALALSAESARIGRRGAGREAAWLPAVFVSMHLAWGAGFLLGSARFGVPVAAIRLALHPR